LPVTKGKDKDKSANDKGAFLVNAGFLSVSDELSEMIWINLYSFLRYGRNGLEISSKELWI